MTTLMRAVLPQNERYLRQLRLAAPGRRVRPGRRPRGGLRPARGRHPARAGLGVLGRLVQRDPHPRRPPAARQARRTEPSSSSSGARHDLEHGRGRHRPPRRPAGDDPIRWRDCHEQPPDRRRRRRDLDDAHLDLPASGRPRSWPRPWWTGRTRCAPTDATRGNMQVTLWSPDGRSAAGVVQVTATPPAVGRLLVTVPPPARIVASRAARRSTATTTVFQVMACSR